MSLPADAGGRELHRRGDVESRSAAADEQKSPRSAGSAQSSSKGSLVPPPGPENAAEPASAERTKGVTWDLQSEEEEEEQQPQDGSPRIIKLTDNFLRLLNITRAQAKHLRPVFAARCEQFLVGSTVKERSVSSEAKEKRAVGRHLTWNLPGGGAGGSAASLGDDDPVDFPSISVYGKAVERVVVLTAYGTLLIISQRHGGVVTDCFELGEFRPQRRCPPRAASDALSSVLSASPLSAAKEGRAGSRLERKHCLEGSRPLQDQQLYYAYPQVHIVVDERADTDGKQSISLLLYKQTRVAATALTTRDEFMSRYYPNTGCGSANARCPSPMPNAMMSAGFSPLSRPRRSAVILPNSIQPDGGRSHRLGPAGRHAGAADSRHTPGGSRGLSWAEEDGLDDASNRATVGSSRLRGLASPSRQRSRTPGALQPRSLSQPFHHALSDGMRVEEEVTLSFHAKNGLLASILALKIKQVLMHYDEKHRRQRMEHEQAHRLPSTATYSAANNNFVFAVDPRCSVRRAAVHRKRDTIRSRLLSGYFVRRKKIESGSTYARALRLRVQVRQTKKNETLRRGPGAAGRLSDSPSSVSESDTSDPSSASGGEPDATPSTPPAHAALSAGNRSQGLRRRRPHRPYYCCSGRPTSGQSDQSARRCSARLEAGVPGRTSAKGSGTLAKLRDAMSPMSGPDGDVRDPAIDSMRKKRRPMVTIRDIVTGNVMAPRTNYRQFDDAAAEETVGGEGDGGNLHPDDWSSGSSNDSSNPAHSLSFYLTITSALKKSKAKEDTQPVFKSRNLIAYPPAVRQRLSAAPGAPSTPGGRQQAAEHAEWEADELLVSTPSCYSTDSGAEQEEEEARRREHLRQSNFWTGVNESYLEKMFVSVLDDIEHVEQLFLAQWDRSALRKAQASDRERRNPRPGGDADGSRDRAAGEMGEWLGSMGW